MDQAIVNLLRKINALEASLARLKVLEAQSFASGSWTPILQGTGTPGTFTYTVQMGRYVLIGKLCSITFAIHISVVSVAPTGNLTVRTLPFTSVTLTSYNVAIPLSMENVNVLATTVQLTGRISSNVTFIDFVESGDNIAGSLLPASAISAGTTVVGSFAYETA